MNESSELKWCRAEIERLRTLVRVMSDHVQGRYITVEWNMRDPLTMGLAILVSGDDDAESMASALAERLIPLLKELGARPTGEVKVNR